MGKTDELMVAAGLGENDAGRPTDHRAGRRGGVPAHRAGRRQSRPRHQPAAPPSTGRPGCGRTRSSSSSSTTAPTVNAGEQPPPHAALLGRVRQRQRALREHGGTAAQPRCAGAGGRAVAATVPVPALPARPRGGAESESRSCRCCRMRRRHHAVAEARSLREFPLQRRQADGFQYQILEASRFRVRVVLKDEHKATPADGGSRRDWVDNWCCTAICRRTGDSATSTDGCGGTVWRPP